MFLSLYTCLLAAPNKLFMYPTRQSSCASFIDSEKLPLATQPKVMETTTTLWQTAMIAERLSWAEVESQSRDSLGPDGTS